MFDYNMPNIELEKEIEAQAAELGVSTELFRAQQDAWDWYHYSSYFEEFDATLQQIQSFIDNGGRL